MHPMRRKDKERDAAFAWQVLRDATYATLAMTDSDGSPYADRGRKRNVVGSLPTITGIFGLTIANMAIMRLSRP